jgi:hypothetical protein
MSLAVASHQPNSRSRSRLAGGRVFWWLYDKQTNNHDPSEVLSNHVSLGDVKAGAFVVRDVTDNCYRLFDSAAQYWKWQATVPEARRTFDEVCFGSLPQRLKFDIDAEVEKLDAIPSAVFERLMPGHRARLLGKTEDNRRSKAEAAVMFLASLIADVFEMRYAKTQFRIRPEDLLVMSSLGGEEKKYSYHILVMPVQVANHFEARDFTAQVFSELREEAPELVSLLDEHVNSSTQCFRLPNSQKVGSGRPKIVSPALGHRLGTCVADTPISQAVVYVGADEPNRPHTLPPLLTQECLQPSPEALTDDDEKAILRHIMAHSPTASSHRYRRRMGTLFIFEREKPSHCGICSRTHENENSLVVVACPSHLSEQGTTNQVEVRLFEKCRRASQLDSTGGLTIDLGVVLCSRGAFPTAGTGLGARAATIAKASQLERVVAALQEKRRDPHASCDHLFETLPFGQKVEYDESTMRPYSEVDTLAVKAQVGVGKTRELAKYLKLHFPEAGEAAGVTLQEPAVIRFITFRQTFARSVAAQIPFRLYSDQQLPFQITAAQAPRLIIQVESLDRLITEAVTGVPIDLLILDEVESVLGQFSSGLHRSFSDAFTTFQWLIGTAKRVICMDANLSDRTFRILQRFRPGRPVHFHWNKYSRAGTDTIHVTTDRGEWLARITDAVASDKRIVLASNSLREAKVIKRYLQEEFPTKKSILYSSETSQAIKELHFADVGRYWTEVDILIYTPTVSAGISYERDHFDCMFVYLSDLSCDVETARQMLGRVRNLRDKAFHVCFSASGGRYPTDLPTLEKLVYSRRQLICSGATTRSTGDRPSVFAFDIETGLVQPFRSPYFALWLETLRIQNLSKNGFAERFADQAADTGARIVYFSAKTDEPKTQCKRDEVLEKKKDVAARIAAEDSNAVATALDLSPEEVIDIRQRISSAGRCSDGTEVLPEERQALRKFQLRQCYNWKSPMTQVFVEDLQGKKIQQWFRNLEYIFMYSTMEEALASLGAEERRIHIALDNATTAATDDANAPPWRSRGLLDRLEHSAIQRRDRFPSHYFSMWLLRLCGFRNLLDTAAIPKEWLLSRLMATRALITKHMPLMLQEFGGRHPGPRFDSDELMICGPALLQMANAALRKTYGFEVKGTGWIFRLKRLDVSLAFGWEDEEVDTHKDRPTFRRQLQPPDMSRDRPRLFVIRTHYVRARVALPGTGGHDN